MIRVYRQSAIVVQISHARKKGKSLCIHKNYALHVIKLPSILFCAPVTVINCNRNECDPPRVIQSDMHGLFQTIS